MTLPAPYPLTFEPFFQNYLWGGRKLGTVLQKPIPAEGVWAESWEVVEHHEHTSRVSNGPLAGKSLSDLRQQAGQWLLGSASNQDRFPLLLKYLDCQRVLSVQVHPDDAYAARLSPPDKGKTEAWYVIDAEPGAKIYAGLKRGVTRGDLVAALEAGTVDQLLHVVEPQPGDSIFIPAGTVHALGAGILAAEIQQSSNVTFRLFDWNRVGPDGKPRPLHVEQALEVIDFDAGPRTLQTPQPTDSPHRMRLVQCEYFVLDRLHGADSTAGDNRFHILTVPQGTATLQWAGGNSLEMPRGQTALLPAAMPTTKIIPSPDGIVLDMYLPESK